MSKRLDNLAQMRRKFTFAIVKRIGLRESIAVEFADAILDALQADHGGGNLYIPARRRTDDVEAIEECLREGRDPAWVCKRFALSRRHLNRLFPGGLPRQKKSDAA